MQYLIVVRAFASYRIGDLITDEATIEAVTASEHSTHVVRILPPGEG